MFTDSKLECQGIEKSTIEGRTQYLRRIRIRFKS